MPVLPHLSTGQLVTATHHNDIVDAINGVTANNYLLALTAFGTHQLNGGGTGAQGLLVRNISGGVGNLARIDVMNESAQSLNLLQLSSTYTTSGYLVSGGAVVAGDGPGGLSIAALNAGATAHLRFYVSSGSERMRLSTAGTLMLTAAGTMAASAYQASTGLMINQGASSDEAICFKSSGVAHGMTLVADTNTNGTMTMVSATDGGITLNGFTESAIATIVRGFVTSNDTTRATGASAAVVIHGYKKSGTNFGTLGANSNILAVGDNNTVRFILDSDGDSHQDVGTTWTNFHGHNDIELLNTLAAHLTRPEDPLRRHFVDWLEVAREPLEEMRLVTFNEDGHHFVNWSRMQMLQVGALLQLSDRIRVLEQARIDSPET